MRPLVLLALLFAAAPLHAQLIDADSIKATAQGSGY